MSNKIIFYNKAILLETAAHTCFKNGVWEMGRMWMHKAEQLQDRARSAPSPVVGCGCRPWPGENVR